MVEAVIAEISEDSVRDLGINFLLDGSAKGGPIGFSNFDGATGRIVNSVTTARAGGAPALDGGLSLALGNFVSGNVDFGLLFSAIASNADNNIISTPTLVTLDNEEAEIVVGTNVPFITGQQLSANNDNPFQTIERQDIGLRLKVKPQINEGDTIKLELEQEVSNVNATALTGAADITTSTRSITTTVLVDHGQTLVLGGLKDDSITDVVEKVPLLGDIPIMGRLFQYKSKTKSKTSLVIFLRPLIMRDSDVASQVSDTKYREMRARRLLAQQGGSGDRDEEEIPELKVLLGDRRTRPQPLIKQNRPAPDLDSLEWVEMPDGSLVLK